MGTSADKNVAELVERVHVAREAVHERMVEQMGERVQRSRERLRSASKTPKSTQTRRRIMQTASEIMIERGNTAFGMSEVAHRCGMSKGALYYYFSNRDDLLAAIFEEEAEGLVADIDRAVNEAVDAGGALRGACHAFAERMRRVGPLGLAIVRELLLTRRNGEPQIAGGIYHIMDVIAGQLERAKDEGLVRGDVDARLAAVSVCGAFAFTAMDAAGGAGEAVPVADDFAEELFQLVVCGIGTDA